jgi:hypothetical protein
VAQLIFESKFSAL